jgi:hypothetical protein
MFNSVGVILKRIWDIEVHRNKQKGLKNFLIGVCLLCLFFYYFPILGKSIWPEKVENKILFQLAVSNSIFIGALLFLPLLYLPGYLGAESYQKFEI